MTKQHFIEAAAMVRSILEGEWTDEPPGWAEASRGDWQGSFDEEQEHYTRAVQTAEALILLFQRLNPRFDQTRFLIACGLADKPVKPARQRRTA